MNCKWCGKAVEYPAKRHVSPPCKEAPQRIHKKWIKEKPLRDKLKLTLDIIARMAKGE